MTELDDHELLGEFVRHGSETAFATLVAKHVGLVYSAAYRSTGNTHQAEEIAQAVFIILARKAARLSPRVVLSGWLYQTARLTAANYIKSESRRQHREQAAYMESTLNESAPQAWEQISPLLEEAMGGLGETDRNAIVLHYFENRNVTEISQALRVNEAAARKRVSRAVEKLRKFFSQRGATLTVGVIAGAISANSVMAAPTGLAQTISGVALSKGATAATSTLALVKGTLKMIAWSKVKVAMIIALSVVLAVGTATVVVEKMNRSVEKYFMLIDRGLLRDGLLARGPLSNAPAYYLLRPTHYPNSLNQGLEDNIWMIGRNVGIKSMISSAYGVYKDYRQVLPDQLPDTGFDFLIYKSNGGAVRLQNELRQRFGYTARWEMRNEDVLVMTVKNTNAAGLTPSSQPFQVRAPDPKLMLDVQLYPVTNLDFLMEQWLGKPVIDQTGLQGLYDVKLDWKGGQEELKQAVLDQWGLEFTPTNLPIEKLIVEKTAN